MDICKQNEQINENKKGPLLINFHCNNPKNRVSVPTQQYYNGACMEETVHDITTKNRQRKKPMTTTDKDEVEGYFNFKTTRNNIMYNLFYSNISEFSSNLQGMLDEGTYKTTI